MFSLVVTFHRKHEGLGNRLSQMYLQSTTKTFKNEDVAPNPKPWGFTVGFGGKGRVLGFMPETVSKQSHQG